MWRQNTRSKEEHYGKILIASRVKGKWRNNILFYSYVVPVVFLAILLNVPKFLEARFEWTNSTNVNGSLEYELSYTITELRDDPNYIQFYINWTRLITTGIIPMSALIYFNFGIFRGIQMTHERVKKKNKQRAGEMNLATMLLCIGNFHTNSSLSEQWVAVPRHHPSR